MTTMRFYIDQSGGVVGENLLQNKFFYIIQNNDITDHITFENNISEDTYELNTILSIYQSDIPSEYMYDMINTGETVETIQSYLEKNNLNYEWTYLGDLTVNTNNNELIIDNNKNFTTLTINNKIVTEITNNSNNKIIDSISMNDNIIYQRQNNIHVNKKIDTDFIYHTGVFLVDIDGNGLGGKEIKCQTNYGNQLVTYTHITQENGYTYINSVLGDPSLKCILFEGDEEYNSCLYENSNYRPGKG